MKQSLLNSLKGLPSLQAQAVAQQAGLRTEEVASTVQFLPTIAKGNTVILFVNEETNLVEDAIAGDPCQLEHDVKKSKKSK